MFGIDSTELLVIVIVALVVIGPKDLPRVLYKVGKVVGQARAMARHFRTGVDAMIREAELEELQKQWAKENERIMAAHPVTEPVATEKAIIDETAVMTGPSPTSVEEVLGKEPAALPAPAPDEAAPHGSEPPKEASA